MDFDGEPRRRGWYRRLFDVRAAPSPSAHRLEFPESYLLRRCPGQVASLRHSLKLVCEPEEVLHNHAIYDMLFNAKS